VLPKCLFALTFMHARTHPCTHARCCCSMLEAPTMPDAEPEEEEYKEHQGSDAAGEHEQGVFMWLLLHLACCLHVIGQLLRSTAMLICSPNAAVCRFNVHDASAGT
jgi:hypothetical protein